MKLQRFASVEDVLNRLDPSYPMFCVFPEVLKNRARLFIDNFPGTVMYAVKCNPHEFVLKAFHEAGVRDFDTASLTEIARINELFDDARCYFNHPVKGRGVLDSANRVYGIKDYVIDHIGELDKLTEVVGTDIIVEVRIGTPKGSAIYDLSSKFGASEDDAVALLKEANRRGCKTAIAFHVGSQCIDPDAYRVAMELAAKVAGRAGVPIEYLDVGGGFPGHYTKDIPPLTAYFDVIRKTNEHLALGVKLFCEPGRALVADGCSILTQVHLRKGEDLYLNDGIYGCLSEVRDGYLDPPVRALGRRRTLQGELVPFRIFGPTCDSIDQLRTPFHLPSDISEGDWIEVGLVGAYSLALQSGFNGFLTDAVVKVDGINQITA